MKSLLFTISLSLVVVGSLTNVLYGWTGLHVSTLLFLSCVMCICIATFLALSDQEAYEVFIMLALVLGFGAYILQALQ